MRPRLLPTGKHVAAIFVAALGLFPAACILDLSNLGGGEGTNGTCTCFGPPPTGWTGYVALYDGPVSQRPGCTGAFPTSMYQGNATISAPSATCSPCTCLPPTGATCAASTNQIYAGDAPCGTPISCETALAESPGWDGSCDGTSNYAPGGRLTCGGSCGGGTAPCNQQVSATPLQFDAGSCAASAQTPELSPYGWSTLGEACAPLAMPAAGCTSANDVCVPILDAGLHQALCIMKVGEASCPAGAFAERHVFYDGVTDARTCTSCTCTAPKGGGCAATVTVYSGASCSDPPLATLHPTSESQDCANLSGNPQVQARMESIQVTNGTCAADGGTPSGAATPIDPTTFCCIP